MALYLIKASPVANSSRVFYPDTSTLERVAIATPGIVGGPRIVRQNVDGVFRTFMTILVDTTNRSGAVENLYQRLTSEFNVNQGIWDVGLVGYDQTRNGSPDWWRYESRNTNSKDIMPGDPYASNTENTIGPTPGAASSEPAPGAASSEPGPSFKAFVVKELSFVGANAPPVEHLRDLFRRVRMPAGSRWLGPDPRVTRFVSVGDNETYAVWVAFFEDPSTSGSQIRSILYQLQALLDGPFSGYTWERAQAMDLDTRFGTPQFWVSGQAARTKTWRTFSYFDRDENPYGPDDPALRPSTMSEWTARGLGEVERAGAGSILWPIAIAAIVGAAVYFFGPVGRAASEGYASGIRQRTRKQQMDFEASFGIRQNPLLPSGRARRARRATRRAR